MIPLNNINLTPASTTTPSFAKASDATDLAQLETLCFTSDKLSAAQYRRLISKPSAMVYIIKDKAHLIASAVILLRKNSGIARLYSIAVHPDHQGSKIAKHLYLGIETHLKERHISEIRLEVRKDNEKAIQFYLKNGYVIFGTYSEYYQDGEDALRMHKILTPL